VHHGLQAGGKHLSGLNRNRFYSDFEIGSHSNAASKPDRDRASPHAVRDSDDFEFFLRSRFSILSGSGFFNWTNEYLQ
jgi:hypothetical protein